MTKPREHPILFSGPMVRAILERTKTQTRRVITPQPERRIVKTAGAITWRYPDREGIDPDSPMFRCPYGQPGDRLWVRETWALTCGGGWACDPSYLTYRAGGDGRVIRPDRFSPIGNIEQRPQPPPGKWKPSIHMPRWASRITLEVRAVRVERLQDITEADCESEGCERSRLLPKDCNPFRANALGYLPPLQDGTRRGAFACLWNLLNEKRGHGWESNPWVWVIEFEKVSP